MKRLHLIRHGATKEYEQRLYYGSTDVPLSENGKTLLIRYREQGIYPPAEPLRIITSGMRRTEETLEILYGKHPHEIISGFREMDFGRFELHSYEELKDDPDYQGWIGDEAGNIPTPDGESARDFRERIFAAANQLREDALLVCHGGVIAALMARWFPHEGKNMYQWQPGFGQGYEVQWETDLPNYRILAVEKQECR